MLFGLAHGQRTIADALAVERQTLIDAMGITADEFDFPTNGSGSPDSRATPRAAVRMLTEMDRSPVAAFYHGALPVLGVDGSLAHSGTELPARGHVFAKTGTTIADGELKAQNLAGYVEARRPAPRLCGLRERRGPIRASRTWRASSTTRPPSPTSSTNPAKRLAAPPSLPRRRRPERSKQRPCAGRTPN